MRDLKYYADNIGRYEKALPRLRLIIQDIEMQLHGLRIIAKGLLVGDTEELAVVKRLENKRASILIQIGRIQGILTVIDAPIKDPEIKEYIFRYFVKSENP